MKFIDVAVGFAEIPDEITLCINISGCSNHCKGCHSPWLWKDEGEELTEKVLKQLIDRSAGISCVCFMGGDQNVAEINRLSIIVKTYRSDLKVAWYSGKEYLDPNLEVKNFNYIKVGPYIQEKGPLNSKTTNQKLYEYRPEYSEISVGLKCWRDITYKFWTNNVD